jgi:hypothetical protein
MCPGERLPGRRLIAGVTLTRERQASGDWSNASYRHAKVVAERIANSEAEALGNPVKTIDKAYAINVALFEKYPHDVLNFSGSNGYRTMKDDTPADHEQVKKHVAAGHGDRDYIML